MKWGSLLIQGLLEDLTSRKTQRLIFSRILSSQALKKCIYLPYSHTGLLPPPLSQSLDSLFWFISSVIYLKLSCSFISLLGHCISCFQSRFFITSPHPTFGMSRHIAVSQQVSQQLYCVQFTSPLSTPQGLPISLSLSSLSHSINLLNYEINA